MTKNEMARCAAREILNAARKNHNRIVTRDLIDEVMSRDIGTPWGSANVRTVMMKLRENHIPGADTLNF